MCSRTEVCPAGALTADASLSVYTPRTGALGRWGREEGAESGTAWKGEWKDGPRYSQHLWASPGKHECCGEGSREPVRLACLNVTDSGTQHPSEAHRAMGDVGWGP